MDQRVQHVCEPIGKQTSTYKLLLLQEGLNDSTHLEFLTIDASSIVLVGTLFISKYHYSNCKKATESLTRLQSSTFYHSLKGALITYTHEVSSLIIKTFMEVETICCNWIDSIL